MATRPIRDHGVRPPHKAWSPWTPQQVGEMLTGFAAPWSFVGGWALDLWLGRQTRFHQDIEIAVLRSDFAAVRKRFSSFRLYMAAAGKLTPLAPGAEPPSDVNQVWVLDNKTRRWKLDIMLEPGDQQTWVFRREPTITRARADMIGSTADGLPYLRPEGVLLFKAKGARSKDQADFSTALPSLDRMARDWLANALTRMHPGHQWIDAIAGITASHGER